MAIPFEALDESRSIKIPLPAPPCSILDIGLSNVYDCTQDRLRAWMEKRGIIADHSWLTDFTLQSGFDSSGNRINGAFLRELCAKIGIEYRALDIMEAARVMLFDLNRDSVPDELCETFDLVLNSGTTEHVLNQFNAFKVIHDATKPGGEMLHLLPISGHTDHGYVHYTSRFFFDLAGYNDYEILEANYIWGGASSKLFDSLRAYSSCFPILRETEARGLIGDTDRYGADPLLPDIGAMVRYRKQRSAQFAGALDAATSVTPPPRSVLDSYDRRGILLEQGSALQRRPAATLAALERERTLRLEAQAERDAERMLRTEAEVERAAMCGSTCWRLTAPLRGTIDLFKRLRATRLN